MRLSLPFVVVTRRFIASCPAGAGTRCLVDCPIEPTCLYSARKHYLDHPTRWAFYVWQPLEHLANPTMDDMVASLRGDNPYGRCVWKCDNDVVDNQTVAMQFAGGASVVLFMHGHSHEEARTMRYDGTRATLRAKFD